jgi:mRNA interferase MazF
VNRGEVYWLHYRPPDRKCPVVVLTRDSAIPYLNEVTVAPITSTIRGIRSEVVVGVTEGMASPCAVNLDHVRTVPKNRLGDQIGSLDESMMREVAASARFALGLS